MHCEPRLKQADRFWSNYPFIMRFAYLVPIISFVAASVADPYGEVISSPGRALDIIKVASSQAFQPGTETRSLRSCDCKYNGCKCRKGLKPGVYCGNCTGESWLITRKHVKMHAFQCARSRECCSYGSRGVCNEWGAMSPE